MHNKGVTSLCKGYYQKKKKSLCNGYSAKKISLCNGWPTTVCRVLCPQKKKKFVEY